MIQFEDDEGIEGFEVSTNNKFKILLRKSCPFYVVFDIISHFFTVAILQEYINHIDIICTNVCNFQAKIYEIMIASGGKLNEEKAILKIFEDKLVINTKIKNSFLNLIYFIENKIGYYYDAIRYQLNLYLENQLKNWTEQIKVVKGFKVSNIVEEWSQRRADLNEQFLNIKEEYESAKLSWFDRIITRFGWDRSFKKKEKFKYLTDIKVITEFYEKDTLYNPVFRQIKG